VATTLRLDPTLADQLRDEAIRTGRSQTALITEAIREKLNGGVGHGANLPDLPPPTPFQDFPEDLVLKGGPPTEQVLDLLRTERF